ncbi:transglutaminaseTgpA domain-containing protein [Neisseria sp. Ec49-e6-T10]|uniref:transglutaminase family protein n=1 Tax=Neisseria sp. Ec49-e6-T10 TaxID=3140744 RepID=UPI003EB8A23D
MINPAKTYPSQSAQYVSLAALIVVSVPLIMFLPFPVLIAFAVLMLVRLALIPLKKVALPTWQIVLLIVAVAAFVYLNLQSLWGRDGGIAILLLLTVGKSFEGGTIRDWQSLLLASFFLVVGPLLFNQEILSALWMVISLASILFALSVLSQVQLKIACKQTLFAMLLSAPLMVVLFVAIPRLPEPLWRIPQDKTSQSGLSDTLSPGSVSELILSNRQVFNAVFDNNYQPTNNQLYWRMMIMQDFDGLAWKAVPIQYTDNTTPNILHNIQYSITTVDQRGRLPALDYPINYDESTQKGIASTVVVKRSHNQLRRVYLRSNADARLPENLSAGAVRVLSRLPANNPKTQAWAKQLAQKNRSSEAFIKAVLAYLASNGFEYTLQPPTLDHTQNQIDEFLFQSKKGFCEHYASAFAVAMRAGGLPSRVVTGYQGGTYYPNGQFWQVRSKDAHAWTEVWLPEKQEWLRVDPTAVVSASRIEMGIEESLPQEEQALSETLSNGFLSKIQNNTEFYWQQWVVGFDADKQNQLFAKFGFHGVSAPAVLFILILGGVIALIPAILWWRRMLLVQIDPLVDGFKLLKRTLFSDEDYIASLGPLDVLQLLEDNQEHDLYQQVKPMIEEFIQLNYQGVDNQKKAMQWYKMVKKLKISSS